MCCGETAVPSGSGPLTDGQFKTNRQTLPACALHRVATFVALFASAKSEFFVLYFLSHTVDCLSSPMSPFLLLTQPGLGNGRLEITA